MLHAGFAELDITPNFGMKNPAGYNKYYIEKIHDPLKVRASVFDDGKERIVLVGIDVAGLQSVAAVRKGRKEVEQQCGIRQDHILLAASHTHDGGPCFGALLPHKYADAPPLTKELAAKHTIVPAPAYCELVIKQMISAICEADSNKKEALLSLEDACHSTAGLK